MYLQKIDFGLHLGQVSYCHLVLVSEALSCHRQLLFITSSTKIHWSNFVYYPLPYFSSLQQDGCAIHTRLFPQIT